MNFFNYVIEKKLVLLVISFIINCLLVSISGFLAWNLYTYECNEICKEPVLEVDTYEKKSEEKYYVDVKGAVKKPGVYEITNTSIINEVINMAGGFTKNAYTKNINLSKKVTNELVIYVYTTSEYNKIIEEKNPNNNEIEINECVCPEYDITDCITNGNSEIVTNNNEEEITNSDTIISDNNDTLKEEKTEDIKLININTASIEELMTLTGIGESKAKAIIEYRNQTKFTTIEDIKNVSGIGDKAFEKIKDNITVK